MTLTFTQDLDIINIHYQNKFEQPKSKDSTDMTFYLVNYFLVTDEQTERQTDRQKAMHKSLLCMSTGGLKKGVACIY